MILQYITESLRFPDEEDTDCQGESEAMPCEVADGEPAFAIHLWDGKPVCGHHSPVDNIYVPCAVCGERPAYKPEVIEQDPMCQPCLRQAVEKAAEAAFHTSG